MAKIEFLVTRERLEQLEMGIFVDMEDNPKSPRNQLRFLSNFVVNGRGVHLPPDEAFIMLKSMTLEQVAKAAPQIMTQIQEIAAPKI
jgi:hypothetical protein